MNRFTAHTTSLPDLLVVTRQKQGDRRGFLSRLFCADELAEIGWNTPIAQLNHTYTAQKATVRGLHFQYAPYAEMKLVSCIRGEVFDVAVDLRPNSPTFLHWYGKIISAENNQALLIPKGFAHGFQTLSDDVEMIYCHSTGYCQDAESGLNPQDPKLSIEWPLPITALSDRDSQHPLLNNDFAGVAL